MTLGATIKKVPTWGWLLVGGASLGIGYSLYKDRRNPDALEGSAGEESLTAGLGSEDYYYGGAQPQPIGVVSPAAPYDNTGEVGAIGQTAFETLISGITGVFETLPALIDASRPPEALTPLPAAPPPDYSGSPVTAPPAPTPPAPTPTAAPTSVNILGRVFSGAYRYSEVATPNLASRDFNVFWHKPHLDERWRTWKNTSGARQWKKIAEGNFGG